MENKKCISEVLKGLEKTLAEPHLLIVTLFKIMNLCLFLFHMYSYITYYCSWIILLLLPLLLEINLSVFTVKRTGINI